MTAADNPTAAEVLALIELLRKAWVSVDAARDEERQQCARICQEYADEIARHETQPGSGAGRREAVLECMKRIEARR